MNWYKKLTQIDRTGYLLNAKQVFWFVVGCVVFLIVYAISLYNDHKRFVERLENSHIPYVPFMTQGFDYAEPSPPPEDSPSRYKTIDLKVLGWKARVSYIPFMKDSTSIITNVSENSFEGTDRGPAYWLKRGWDGGIDLADGIRRYPSAYISLQKPVGFMSPETFESNVKSIADIISRQLNVRGEKLFMIMGSNGLARVQ